MRLLMPLKRAFSLNSARPTRLQAQRPSAPESPGPLVDGNGEERWVQDAWLLSWRWPVVLATAIVSATVLLLEVTLTRVFSLYLSYHYVFVVLAIALLGLGAGAMCLATTRRWVLRHPVHALADLLWQGCLGYGLTLIVVTGVLTHTALASVLPVAAGLAMLPFVVAGFWLTMVFTIAAGHSRELYAADLCGAGVGCLASLPMLHGFGAENTLALIAASLLVLAAMLALAVRQRHWSFTVLTCLVLGILLGLRVVLGAATVVPLAIWHSHKHLGHLLRTTPQARLVDSHWSALARTDVVALPYPGGEQYVAFTDGGAASVLVPLPHTPAEWAQVDREFGLFPYQTSPHERVLVIGAGGGFDVLLALRGGAQAITAVEVNPDVLRAAERFIPPARNVYHVPTVQVVQGDGRHVIRQSTQQYDLIVLMQVYTGAAEQRSVALAENYVLTTEAFQDYLAHLAPQGRLVVQVHDAAEALKTVFMALGALQQRGIGGPAALQHVALLQRDPGMLEAPDTIRYPVLLLKNTPYTPAESRQQAHLAQEAHVTPLFIPHAVTTGFLETLIQSAAALSFNALPMMWRPATDDRPFFYETETFPASLSWLLSVTVLLLLGLHLWHAAQQQPRATLTTVSTGWLPFFAGTGCAALLAQVALVQRSVLVLGTPTLTMVVLLFPLLCGGGVGSLASTALCDRTLRRVLPWSCIMLGLLLCVYLIVLPGLLARLEQHALLARSLATMGVLVPLGVLMGLPFPAALRVVSPLAPPLTPWAWGVNAVAGVLGSVAAVGIAVAWGLQAVLIVSAAVYGCTGWWAHHLLTATQQPAGLSSGKPVRRGL